jgi:hypothetical protein
MLKRHDQANGLTRTQVHLTAIAAGPGLSAEQAKRARQIQHELQILRRKLAKILGVPIQ